MVVPHHGNYHWESIEPKRLLGDNIGEEQPLQT